jgi:hypothetical protein
MSSAAWSVLAFGVYLAVGGLLLVFAPSEVCNLVGLRPPGETMWVRLSGMFFLDIAFYCIKAALTEQKEFIRWTVWTRPVSVLFIGAFVAFGLENPVFLLFGVLDGAATLWTVLALRRSTKVGEIES